MLTQVENILTRVSHIWQEIKHQMHSNDYIINLNGHIGKKGYKYLKKRHKKCGWSYANMDQIFISVHQA